MNWQHLERFWHRQNSNRRLCFATAAAALGVAALVAVVSLFDPYWNAVEGLVAVAAFYVLCGLLDRSHSPAPTHYRPVLPSSDRMRQLRDREESIREAWKDN